jgi:hypothetical protein
VRSGEFLFQTGALLKLLVEPAVVAGACGVPGSAAGGVGIVLCDALVHGIEE